MFRTWRTLLSLVFAIMFAVLVSNVLTGQTNEKPVQIVTNTGQSGDGEIGSASPLTALTAGNVIGRRGRSFGARRRASYSRP